MGTSVHVVVHGPDELADLAVELVHDHEARWSRFRPDSEVSRLNDGAGSWVEVSPATVELVERAVQAHAVTGGRFDPTVLGDVIRAGYDRSYDDLDADRAEAPASDRHRGIDGVEVDRAGGAVRLPAGVGFDPGGIGKGLAADRICQAIDAEGAAGAMVNLGGDLRAIGFAPDGDEWTVDLDPAATGTALMRVGIDQGAVATSTTLRRRWHIGGEARHHLIDPATGGPAAGDVVAVSVIAAQGWQAEVLAKAALLAGVDDGTALVASTGAAALLVDRRGRHHATPGLETFTITTEAVGT